jgi:DNA-binding FadR family transcriptional regulator
LAIARAAHNRFFLAGVEEVLLILSDILAVLPESEVWQERSFKEYGPIVGAIEVRDGASAREAMHVHIARNDRSMRFFLAAL